MLKVVFLGTSGSTPTDERGLPSVCIEYEGDIVLFDCGEGTQRQMMLRKVNFSKVKAIFLTHVHGDHTIGVAGLVRTLSLHKREAPLEIFIPKGHEGAIQKLIDFDSPKLSYKINIRPMAGGTVYKGKGYSVKAFKLLHTVPTYGLSFEEDPRMRFDSKKAERLGIKGEMYSKLAKGGRIRVNGKVIMLSSVAKKQDGRKVVYATDTRPAKATESAARNANLLVHEATYSDKLKGLAMERMHSTALECARIAKRAKVNSLVLTHISARYRNESELLDEAKAVFKNTRLAKDGMEIEITGP